MMEEEGMYYLYGADQLRGYREADLRLLFSHMQNAGFLMTWLILFFRYTRYKQTTFSRSGIYQKPTTFLFGDLGSFAKHVISGI